jgi:hypothetical protein
MGPLLVVFIATTAFSAVVVRQPTPMALKNKGYFSDQRLIPLNLTLTQHRQTVTCQF